MAALKCLALVPGAVRYDLLHPYKPRVLKDLAKALDDPKRAVRKEAVDARFAPLSTTHFCRSLTTIWLIGLNGESSHITVSIDQL